MTVTSMRYGIDEEFLNVVLFFEPGAPSSASQLRDFFKTRGRRAEDAHLHRYRTEAHDHIQEPRVRNLRDIGRRRLGA